MLELILRLGSGRLVREGPVQRVGRWGPLG